MTGLPDVTPDITATLRHVNRTRWALTLLVALIVAGALGTLGVVVVADQAKLRTTQTEITADTVSLRADRAALLAALERARASCAFYRDLAPVPVTTGPNGKASRLGVQIISDSRAAFVGQTCPGQLPPPSPSLIRWARYYGIAIVVEPNPPPP